VRDRVEHVVLLDLRRRLVTALQQRVAAQSGDDQDLSSPTWRPSAP
jgi:hypothetical protein